MIPSRIDLLTRCYGGGGGVPKPRPPAAPAPSQAAENVAKNAILERTRRARGFASTILGGAASQPERPATLLKTLLGG